jgi:hypothetical protein
MLTKNYEPVDVVQSRTMSPTCVMDSMGAASHELSVLCHKIEEDIINGKLIPTESSSTTGQMKKVAKGTPG